MPRRVARVAVVAAAVAVLGSVPALAQSPRADIEAVWSFSGGQVAVQAAEDGGYTGKVIRQTTFSECPHPVGEVMWLGLRAQPDGQYWGGHQWYTTSTCAPIERRGNTAFRVLARPDDGAKFLRVCFGQPETPEVQPSIAADGSSTNVNRGCADSDLVSPLPEGKPTVEQIATLPKQGKKRCLSRRSFKIRLKEPPGDALESATVFVNGKQVEVRRGRRLTAPVSLKGLPKGRYTVKIVATTVLGETITGKRRYRTCVKRRRSNSPGPV
jgi:hypothetical protein